MKRKKRKDTGREHKQRAQYIMIHLSFDEIKAAYGPGSSCKNLTDAIETFHEDMIKEAEYRGYEGASLFSPVASLYTDWIRTLWENYDAEGSMGSEDPDNDGRCDDSSDVEGSLDGASTGEA